MPLRRAGRSNEITRTPASSWVLMPVADELDDCSRTVMSTSVSPPGMVHDRLPVVASRGDLMYLPRPVGLAGLRTWVPREVQTAPEAVRLGLVDVETADELGYGQLPVAAISAPEMAVLAARRALASTPWTAAEIGLVLHSHIYYQGHDMWSPAHYIADQLELANAVPMGVAQLCNGGAAALGIAIAQQAADPEYGPALVTTADRFADTGFDRWRGDYGLAYGDGATAVVVQPPGCDLPAELTLHAITTAAAADLESMHRGQDAFAPAARSAHSRVDLRRTKKAFFETKGMETFVRVSGEKLRTVVRGCLEHHEKTARQAASLRYVILPRLGLKTLHM